MIELTVRRIIEATISVYRTMGAGLVAHVYETCLAYELMQSGLLVGKHLPVTVYYKRLRIDSAFHIDLLVENQVTVEVLAERELKIINYMQLQSYLEHSKAKCGILVNVSDIISTSNREGNMHSLTIIVASR